MSENQIELIGNREVELLEKQRKVNLQKLFTPEGMDAIIGTIKKEVADFKADVSTKEGRAKIVSMAAKVAKCKSPIEKLAKEAKDESQKIIAGIQVEWKRYEAEMDTLRDDIRKPVDDIEEAEAKQLEERQKQIALIEQYRHANFANSPSMYEDSIKQIRQLMQFDWGDDWIFRAETGANEIIAILEEKVAAAKKYQADQAELAQLKKEKEDREKKDREDQIAKDAKEKERKDSEEREAKAIEDKRVAEEKAIVEKRKSQLLELRLYQSPVDGCFVLLGNDNDIEVKPFQFLAKVSDQIWEALLERVAADIAKVLEKREKARLQKIEDDKKQAADDAVEKERLRVEEEKRKEDEATEKREKNRRHCAKINNEALTKILSIFDEDLAACNEAQDFSIIGKKIVEAIAKGEVPHVQINY